MEAVLMPDNVNPPIPVGAVLAGAAAGTEVVVANEGAPRDVATGGREREAKPVVAVEVIGAKDGTAGLLAPKPKDRVGAADAAGAAEEVAMGAAAGAPNEKPPDAGVAERLNAGGAAPGTAGVDWAD